MRLSAIGDVVHTLPVLSALREHGFECGWAVEPLARPLLAGQPALQHVEPVPAARRFVLGEAREALRSMRGHAYDVALDLQGLWKSAAWARLSGAPRVVGYASPARRERGSAVLLREVFVADAEPAHVIDQNLALLKAVGIDAVGHRGFPLPAREPEQTSVAAALQTAGFADQPFVVLNPGGGWASKQWPAERFGELARMLAARGLRSLVTWGPGEEGLAAHVVEASGNTAVRCFPTTLLEYLEVARRARLVVAADTGPLHLACAVRTPVVGIFGPTDPARNGPFSRDDVTVRRVPSCAPCHKRQCVAHAGVMAAIDPVEVLAAVERRLHTGPSSPEARAV